MVTLLCLDKFIRVQKAEEQVSCVIAVKHGLWTQVWVRILVLLLIHQTGIRCPLYRDILGSKRTLRTWLGTQNSLLKCCFLVYLFIFCHLGFCLTSKVVYAIGREGGAGFPSRTCSSNLCLQGALWARISIQWRDGSALR